ncbi:HAD family hydrolase [Desulfoluna spongiiphila]|uniref:phosphoglycolate phosphatase n=1 Tax=Desulfoluna spongiiphila TaxID=419481 RepID=A0A1G5ALR7_9BACT|nr:HAD family hydrolase [Desulfoluna spongiiphila]SCX78760.1 phosphoglycolate phosphatase [Desulfoluna spongiiphila]
MTSKIKGVVFDLDGTLIDSLEEIATATNRTLEAFGYPTHPEEAFKYFAGHGARVLVERAAPKDVVADPHRFEPLLERFLSAYHRLTGTIAHPYEGIPDLLTALAERGIKLFVLTNKPHESAGECVADIMPHWAFDQVLGARDNVPRKPDPAGAVEILETTGIKGEEMLYLGDTAVDMKTAVGAGMVPVGVLWGFRERKELEESGAKHLINHPLELLELL